MLQKLWENPNASNSIQVASFFNVKVLGYSHGSFKDRPATAKTTGVGEVKMKAPQEWFLRLRYVSRLMELHKSNYMVIRL